MTANAVKGTVVAGAVGTAKEYGAEAVDYTFGQGSSQKGVNNLSKAEQIRKEMKTYDTFNGNPFGLNEVRVRDPNREDKTPVYSEGAVHPVHVAHEVSQVDTSDHFRVPDIAAGAQFIERRVVFDSSVTSDSQYESKDVNYKLVKIFGQDTVPLDSRAVNSSKEIKEADLYNQNLHKPTVNQVIISPNNRLITDPRRIGCDIGTLVGRHAIESAYSDNKNGINDLQKVADQNPELKYLLPKVIDFTKNVRVPDTRIFKQYLAKYTGQGINTDSVTMTVGSDGLKVFTGIDEFGTAHIYKERKTGIKLPTLQGVWTGPNSPNNALPVNLLDTFSFFHDIDYHNGGWFNLEGDYKYIARLYQNLARMADNEREIAKFAINYFSTIGHTLSAYKQSLDPLVANKPIKDQSQDDIFPKLVPEAIGHENYVDMRYAFYSGLVDGLQHVEAQSSPLSSCSRTASSGSFVKNRLGSLMLQLQ